MTSASKKVLIVEDEGIIALDLAFKIRNMGYEVSGITATGEDAIHLSQKDPAQVVILDIKLKGKLNGIETARIIKDKYCQNIIFISGNSDTSSTENAFSIQPLAFLQKPIQNEALKNALNRAFSPNPEL